MGAALVVALFCFHGFGAPRVGRLAAARLGLHPGPWAPLALAGAWAWGSILITVALVGRLSGLFLVGLGAAVLVAALTAVLLRGRAYPHLRFERVDAPAWLALFATWAVHARIAGLYQLHDEHALFGHKTILAQLRRGHFPPWFPPFPSHEASYHAGFDVLAAALGELGFEVDLALDGATMLLVGFASLGAAALASEWGGRARAYRGILAVHLSAGLAWLVLAGTAAHPRCLVQFHHPSCGVHLFPPPLFNLHQHPMAAGLGLFLALVLVLEGRPNRRFAAHELAFLVLGLGALGYAQVVFHVLLALSLLGLAVFLAVSGRGRDASILVGIAVAGHLVARAAGGLLLSHPEVDPTLLGWRPVAGWPEGASFAPTLRALWANLGLGGLAAGAGLAVGLSRRRPSWIVLGLTGMAGVLVPQFFVYARSWDIQKFSTAAAYGLGLLTLAGLGPALASRGSWGRSVDRLFFPLVLGGGSLAAAFTTVPLAGELRLYEPTDRQVDPLVAEVIEFLHDRGADRELVLARSNVAEELASYGGLSLLAADGQFYTMGIRRFWDIRRDVAALERDLAPALLEKWNIRWIVYSNEELDALGPVARVRLEQAPELERVLTVRDGQDHRDRHVWLYRPLDRNRTEE